MKKYLLTLGLMAVTALGTLSLRADDTNAAAAVTNAVAAAAAPAARPRRPRPCAVGGTTP